MTYRPLGDAPHPAVVRTKWDALGRCAPVGPPRPKNIAAQMPSLKREGICILTPKVRLVDALSLDVSLGTRLEADGTGLVDATVNDTGWPLEVTAVEAVPR